MRTDLPLFPEAASTGAHQVDALFAIWAIVSFFFSLLIAGLILYFMTRYRRRREDQVGTDNTVPMALEIIWSVIPLGICLVMFAWGAKVFFYVYRPPSDAVEYFAVSKQWMWKFQHPEGNREINELHVPVGQSIKMTMTSEDVIHSFYVPAFRMKQDVLPGRYTTTWFKADKPGTYHLFCAEYCGTEHSKMIGRVVVMEPTAYEAWLSGTQPGQSTVASGAQLFQTLACDTCHRPSAVGMVPRAPRLEGLFGRQVKLADGRTLLADENYLRESIVNPGAKIVAGWTPIMPTFQGQVSEEQLVQIIAYVKSLGVDATASPAGNAGSTIDPAAASETPVAPQAGAPSSPSQKPSTGTSGRPK
jgi:cytochrome c oxidase subunit 2